MAEGSSSAHAPPSRIHSLLPKPAHPGVVLRDSVLPGLDLSVSQAARDLGVSRSALHRMLAGDAALTPEMAARLGRLSSVPGRHWLGLRGAYDLWHAERALADVLRRIPAHFLPRGACEEIEAAAHG